MWRPEETLRAILQMAAGVTSITTSINWGEHPQGRRGSYIHLSQVSGNFGLTLKGTDGLGSMRYQIDCYGTPYNQARQLSREVITALHGYSGGPVRLIEHLDTREGREGGAGEAERLFRVSVDVMLHWREP
jgi:hypothetical protein